MDKIQKALRRLTAKERTLVRVILKDLHSGNLKGRDVKKLKGREDIFRIRKGDIRIIYQLKNGAVFVLTIDRRNENTYKI